jgi:hypothetical protein
MSLCQFATCLFREEEDQGIHHKKQIKMGFTPIVDIR